jgi:hypothetical protein
MIDFVSKQKKKTAIVVDCIDRLQRGFKECVIVDELLKQDKIEIHFRKEGLILHKESSSTDRMRYDMGILSAKMYIGSMTDNVKRSVRHNIVNEGKWQSQAPIGYLNRRDDRDRSIIIPDPDRADKVIRLFQEFSTGLYTVRPGLAALVKEIGLRSRKGNVLTKSSLCLMINNPFYYGVMKFKGQEFPSATHPLISKELFDRCQAVIRGQELLISDTNLVNEFLNLPECPIWLALADDFRTIHRTKLLEVASANWDWVKAMAA